MNGGYNLNPLPTNPYQNVQTEVLFFNFIDHKLLIENSYYKLCNSEAGFLRIISIFLYEAIWSPNILASFLK